LADAVRRRRATRHEEPDREPGDGGGAGCDQESGTPAEVIGNEVAHQEGKRPGDADAGGVAGDGARHHAGIDLVGQQLQPGHVGAGPTQAGEGSGGHRRPEAVGKQPEQEMADRRAADAEQIDALGVDAVGQGDEHRHRNHVGGVEDSRDPAGLAVAERPARDHLRQQRQPEISADLDEDLRGTNNRDQASA